VSSTFSHLRLLAGQGWEQHRCSAGRTCRAHLGTSCVLSERRAGSSSRSIRIYAWHERHSGGTRAVPPSKAKKEHGHSLNGLYPTQRRASLSFSRSYRGKAKNMGTTSLVTRISDDECATAAAIKFRIRIRPAMSGSSTIMHGHSGVPLYSVFR
jgi:hypothetical protein